MFPSPAGEPINLDALAVDVIAPLISKAGIEWHGWHAFRRGLATNLRRLGNVAVTQSCYIKTPDVEVTRAMQQFERSLEYVPNMHLSGNEREQVM